MNIKITKGILATIAGSSAVASVYYGFIKPNLPTEVTTIVPTSTQETIGQSSTTSENTSYQDGSYTGEVVQTRRGDFQVSVEIKEGKISNITMLTQPSAPQSQEINSTAIPTYTQEAINTQSSEIKLISGASETYAGFKGSLQDALNKAR